MEPPEDRLPSGLNYNAFKSAYSKIRKGSTNNEMSAAWNRYKISHPSKSSTSRGTTAVIARPTSPRRSPRTSPIRAGLNLLGLPKDVGRYMSGLEPTIAPLLHKTAKGFKATTMTGYAELCKQDVTTRELEMLLDRKRRRFDLFPFEEEDETDLVDIQLYVTPQYRKDNMHGYWWASLRISVQLERTSYLINNDRWISINMDLGWEFAKRVILDAYDKFITDRWWNINPDEYIRVIDQASLYDVLVHRSQCVALDPGYALQMTEAMLLRARKTLEDVLAIGHGAAVADWSHVLDSVVGQWLADERPIVGGASLDPAQVIAKIRSYIPPEIDPEYSTPCDPQPCIDEITLGVAWSQALTLDMVVQYLDSLEDLRRFNIAWFEFLGREWRPFQVSKKDRDSAWVGYSSRKLVLDHSKVLNADLYDYISVLTNDPERYMVSDMSSRDVAMSYFDIQTDVVFCYRDLHLLYSLNEGCIQRDRFYAERRSKQQLYSILDKMLDGTGLTVSMLQRDASYFDKYNSRKKLTASVFNQLALVWYFIRHVWAVGELVWGGRDPSAPNPKAPYASYSKMLGWSKPRLIEMLSPVPPIPR